MYRTVSSARVSLWLWLKEVKYFKKIEFYNVKYFKEIKCLQSLQVKAVAYFDPETLKYWVDVQQGQSYLMGERCLFSLGWPCFCWCCQDKNALWGRCFTSTSFPPHLSCWVGSDFGFIVRSVETDLEKWTLVVAVISVDANPFLAFSDLTSYLEDTGIGVFWLHCAAW